MDAVPLSAPSVGPGLRLARAIRRERDDLAFAPVVGRRRARGGEPWRHPLLAILVLAFALRLWSATLPTIAHPDEIYQYLEPAHRLLTGEGVVTWEWRVGMRSWLLPALLAPAVALGGWIAPAGALLAPRMLVAVMSLAIPLSAWSLGARVSRLHAVTAAFVAATWFELVWFAGRTLSEPLAVAAILPAAAIVTAPHPRPRALVAAGALLGFAAMLRPHYVPACAVLVLVASGRALPARLPALAAGALAVFAVGAAVDVASGARPFAWVLANVHANLVEHRAARYGTHPLLAYVAWFETMWRWWAIPMLVALRWGWRHSPALFWMALANLALHMLIGHKEYRFILLTAAALTLLAALGTADLVRLGQRRIGGAPLPAAALAAWLLASIALWSGPTMLQFRAAGRAGTLLFAEAARHDVCGVALYRSPGFAAVPGTAGLPPHARLHLFMIGDDGLAPHGPAAALAKGRAGYDAILVDAERARALPADYARVRCEGGDHGPMCLYVRPGGCTDDPAAPTLAGTVLARQDM